MRNDIRIYFDEIHAGLTEGGTAPSYSDDEIANIISSFDTFHCMGPCTPYLTSIPLNRMLYIGDNVEELFGIPRTQVLHMSLTDLVARLFRGEQGVLATAPYKRMMEKVMGQYRGRCDIQINIELGFYHEKLKEQKRLLLQRKPIRWDQDLGLELLGGLMQDITRLKSSGPPEASIICNGELLELFTAEEDDKSMFVDTGFSKKEMEVIRYVDKGMSIEEIAACTGMLRATVYSHRRNIIAKSELPNIHKVIDVLKAKGVL